ncbi:GNAT family N-acetyltransferase [Aquabacter cavernae]|uniref:GNAT family N-acetyltransferase n=1 Tax=Aquabacter cavernae TaxID=2496029 RepID=UPI000F8C4DA9|nr:GNAT family N-acetyltransferase [Aquabacter cavernae]
MGVQVRGVVPEDEAAWRDLWAGYCAFYETQVSPTVTARTFARMLDPAAPMIGRVAERGGRAVGFSISILHDGTWVEAPICYLEDLFVAPDCRGLGIGRALVEDLLALGRAAGWSRLYWHTRTDNPARVLYDLFTPADDFVRYLIRL